jgi:DNA-binding CsgD family transcriptional regulator
MTTPVVVSERDLHNMLRIVNAPDLDEDGDGLPWSTLHGIMEVIPCSVIDFNGIDVAAKQVEFEQDIGELEYQSDDEEIFWAHYPGSPCTYPERTGDYRSVIKTTDFLTLRQYRQTAIHTDFLGPRDQDHSMAVSLPDGPGRQLRLILHRGRQEPDFSERDRGLLALLRPHIYAAHVAVRRRRLGIPELTRRQWELLRLVDVGLSNRQIARRLCVSENTVRKHLENIFERLQVSSRTAALARAFPERFDDLTTVHPMLDSRERPAEEA